MLRPQVGNFALDVARPVAGDAVLNRVGTFAVDTMRQIERGANAVFSQGLSRRARLGTAA